MKSGGIEINPVGPAPKPGSLACSKCGLFFGIRYSIVKMGEVRYFTLQMLRRGGKYICNMCLQQHPELNQHASQQQGKAKL